MVISPTAGRWLGAETYLSCVSQHRRRDAVVIHMNILELLDPRRTGTHCAEE